MTFVKKTWTDRIAEYITRRTLTNVADNSTMVVTVERNEGEVAQEGDPFSAATMNDLEKRIGDEFELINQHLTANNKPFVFGYDSARNKYGYTIDDIFYPFRKGAIYLGQYSADTTIDVSELGAKSADEFIAVAIPQNINASTNGSSGSSAGIAKVTVTYTPPTLTLSDNILTIQVGSIYGYGGGCGDWWLAASKTTNNIVKVYYVGDIETV